jgi:hypothetical protein
MSRESITPPSSSAPPQRSPRTPTKDGTPLLEKDATASPILAADPATQTQESDTSTSNMAKKRSREDDDDEGSSPPKKAASSSKSKTKAKPVPKKSAPKKTLTKPAQKKPAAKKAALPPPPPSSRPSRNRKAPERFENLPETKPLKQLPTKKGGSKVFDPTFITTNSTSRLGKADVYHMLLESSAWSSLSKEQQVMLVSMLPPSCANSSLLAKISQGATEGTRPQAFTMSNDCFRTDVAKFKEDLKNGHLAKTWQAAAEQAVVQRAAGEYDAWKAEEAESWWGQKSDATN